MSALTTEHPGESSLKELAAIFFRLGATSFGGPAAHIAMMEDEIVKRRQWLTEVQFLDMIAATNFIPGPNSTEMAIHIGYQRAGTKGLLVAGSAFILPAFSIVLCLAWLYVEYGSVPEASGFLYGVKPVVVAVVIQALWRLGRTAIRTKFLALLAALSAIANILGAGEIEILFTAAAICALIEPILRPRGADSSKFRCLTPLPGPSLEAGIALGASAMGAKASLSHLFLIFLKIGSVLYGSGYVLLAFLRSDLVERLGWITEAQLLDAVAIGQVTPGPVFTTATFVGYLTAGATGAVAATVGIFLPAFLFVAISAPLLPRLRRSRTASKVLDGLNAASLALMAVVTVQLGVSAIVDWPTTILVLVSSIALILRKINSSWLVLVGGFVGSIVS